MKIIERESVIVNCPHPHSTPILYTVHLGLMIRLGSKYSFTLHL